MWGRVLGIFTQTQKIKTIMTGISRKAAGEPSSWKKGEWEDSSHSPKCILRTFYPHKTHPNNKLEKENKKQGRGRVSIYICLQSCSPYFSRGENKGDMCNNTPSPIPSPSVAPKQDPLDPWSFIKVDRSCTLG